MTDDSVDSETQTADGADIPADAAAKPIPSGGLVVEPPGEHEDQRFISELERTLEETKDAVLDLTGAEDGAEAAKTWQRAREVVGKFRPVPWFVWRLSHYVFGKSGQVNQINEGMVMGLRRLLFAAASDDVMGAGKKINNLREAIRVLAPDVIAAVAVIHGICRRFHSRPFDRVWSPILDDAILRARIGYHVGLNEKEFGAGRGMLAGFAGRAGLAILISTGNLDQAQEALEALAAGKEIKDTGLMVYECDPLQVSAMTLSASGCGRDAAFGTVGYAINKNVRSLGGKEQERWLAAFSIAEALRLGKPGTIDDATWNTLGFSKSEDRTSLADSMRQLTRRGHGWGWLL